MVHETEIDLVTLFCHKKTLEIQIENSLVVPQLLRKESLLLTKIELVHFR